MTQLFIYNNRKHKNKIFRGINGVKIIKHYSSMIYFVAKLFQYDMKNQILTQISINGLGIVQRHERILRYP